MLKQYFKFNQDLFFRRMQLVDQFIGTVTIDSFDNKEIMAVNQDAYEILELLDHNVTIGECIDTLAEKYEVEKKILTTTITSIINELVKKGMGEISQSAPGKKQPVVPACLKLESDFPVNAANIDLLSKCNLKCKHCYGEYGIDRDEVLSTDTVFSLLDQLKDLHCTEVSFSGGEVFLHENFPDILEYAHGYNFKLSFLTNATLITPDVVEGLQKIGHMTIQVSLDGHCAEIHDAFRGVKGSFEKAFRALKMLKKAGFSLVISHVVNQTNYKSIEAMSDLANELNISLKSGPLVKYGNAVSNLEEVYINPETYYDMYKTSRLNHPEESPKQNGDDDNSSTSTDYIERCAAGKRSFTIKTNGDVLPCEIFPQTDKFIMGNIYRSGIREIVYNFDREKRMADFNALNLQKCKSCELVAKCKGGCLAMAYFERGSLDVLDPFSCAKHRALNE
jgi:radical SAM protein with 4Fe4S-binding SPASM domain